MVDFHLTTNEPLSKNSHCIVVAVGLDMYLSDSARIVNQVESNLLSDLFEQGTMTGEYGHIVSAPIGSKRNTWVVTVGIGEKSLLTDIQFRELIALSYSHILHLQAKDGIFYLTELCVQQRDEYWKIRLQAEVIASLSYPIKSLKKQIQPINYPREITLACSEIHTEAAKQGQAIAKGIKTCRDLSNLPANICTPSYLAEYTDTLSRRYNHINVDILNEDELAELGMNVLLSVGAGSAEPSRLIVIRYFGIESDAQPVALVGKGITFDTGGIGLKSRDAMTMMKHDMGGAAAVVGAIQSSAELKLPINIVGIIACAENMPGSRATKPTDVIESMSGKTVEICNTDAEGRLVLCDALYFAERYKPSAVIDIATLTGACVAALGLHYSGLFSNDDELARELISAGKTAIDEVWQLPLSRYDMSQLDSDFADLSNMGDGTAGAVVAALFLSNFTKNYRWAHLDTSGTAKQTTPNKVSTGRPVSLLVHYLMSQCQ